MTPKDLHNIRLDIKELAKKIDQILNRLETIEESNTVITEYPPLSVFPETVSPDTGTTTLIDRDNTNASNTEVSLTNTHRAISKSYR
jgi:hypothetical protein